MCGTITTICFKKAENITKRTYLLNGLWLFFLTLVPFTTGWVGSARSELLPELLYAANLLLWSGAFHLLDRQILRDSPETERDSTTGLVDRTILYTSYAAAILLAFL